MCEKIFDTKRILLTEIFFSEVIFIFIFLRMVQEKDQSHISSQKLLFILVGNFQNINKLSNIVKKKDCPTLLPCFTLCWILLPLFFLLLFFIRCIILGRNSQFRRQTSSIKSYYFLYGKNTTMNDEFIIKLLQNIYMFLLKQHLNSFIMI